MKPSIRRSPPNSLTLLVRACAAVLLAGAAAAASAQVEKPSIKMSQGWLFNEATQSHLLWWWKRATGNRKAWTSRSPASPVTRVVSGSHDIGFADTGTLIKYNAEHPEKPLMIFWHPGRGLSSRGVPAKGLMKPKDLEGKKLGAPTTDGGRQMFPAFAKANGIDESKINWVTMAPNLREQMLVRGEVDGVTGFVTSSVPSINGLGVKTADLNLMMYHQFNLDGFGTGVRHQGIRGQKPRTPPM